MDLPKITELIRKAWCAAENKLVEQVGKYNPGLGEEGITEQLFVLLQEELQNANKDGLVEAAFVEDLSNAHPDIRIDRVENFSQGLIAEVLHNRLIEGTKTGGDFGLILSSPEVERSADKLQFSQKRHGLLSLRRAAISPPSRSLRDKYSSILCPVRPPQTAFGRVFAIRHQPHTPDQLAAGHHEFS